MHAALSPVPPPRGRPVGDRHRLAVPRSAMDNFLAQLEGRKSVLVYPPHCSFDLYPYPTGHPADNFAMADPERPDLGRWPGLARARDRKSVV